MRVSMQALCHQAFSQNKTPSAEEVTLQWCHLWLFDLRLQVIQAERSSNG